MLWAITCYFNHLGYQTRLRNYRIFRRHLTVPLITVELSYNPHFELRSPDADVLVQIRGRDLLWQKERLLNVALRRVPEDCDSIAWLDCDVVFERTDWHELARRELQHFTLVQLFRIRCNLVRDAAKTGLALSRTDSSSDSMGYKIAHHSATADDLRIPGVSTTGMAWAARAEVLRSLGLYDACVIGSGDRALACAALGKYSYAAEGLRMTARQVQHYLHWARPFSAAVRSGIGYIDGRVFHLWHGDLKHRRYVERFQGFQKFEFDPFVDIVLDDQRIWQWNSDKPAMHEYVRRYFESRREDG